MVKKWLHLNFDPQNGWGYEISGAIQEAVKAGKVPPAPREIGELNLHIATRFDMLPRIVKRINQECDDLYKMAKKHGPRQVFTAGHEGGVLNINEDLTYNILIDIDSFLIGKHISKKDIGKIMSRILKEAGKDIAWFIKLDINRNKFIHNATPWIAIDISEEEKNRYDLLIMKENLKEFTDEKKFIRLSDLSEIVHGFREAFVILGKHIANLYA